ncbi:unnamed protein product [Heligmosomoides polygyrus]|uniref:RRM domain-containing protein n=1 Tax=Heligmosomoides polygyrus TaxID=6339 RepID=A0A183FE56_HELPZ|nr:unnamed protein product [Heligmosomoides polygyrus]
MFYGHEDDALQMRWAVVCSVHDESLVNTLSEFSSWFLEQVTKVASRMNIYARFEERPKAVMHAAVGDYDACASAYESIRKNWPAVMFVLHVLPEKNAREYDWMRTLSSIHGFVRQGVLLENALDRFAEVIRNGSDPDEVFKNVAQWVARATSKLCLDKDPMYKPYDLRVGLGPIMPINTKMDQDAIQTAVNTVLSGPRELPPSEQQFPSGVEPIPVYKSHCSDGMAAMSFREIMAYPQWTLDDVHIVSDNGDSRHDEATVEQSTTPGTVFTDVHREESAVHVTGFPSSLNEYGVAQLFNGLKVTGVVIGMDRATVTFATKFLAYQACSINGKKLDRVHTLHVEPVSREIREQLLLAGGDTVL